MNRGKERQKKLERKRRKEKKGMEEKRKGVHEGALVHRGRTQKGRDKSLSATLRTTRANMFYAQKYSAF